MTGFMIGGTIGYFLALPLTYPKIPQKEQILQNSITFELTEKIQEEKNALTKLFGLFVKKKFNYSYLKSIKKNVTIYKYNISFLRRFILIIVEENQITFFPFIKDGYKYDINFNILPYIHVLGKNVLNLNKKEPSTIVVSEFENFTKPNKLISTLKSIKNIRLNKNDLYCIGGLLFLFCILIYLFIIPNLQINLAINLDLIAILITLTSIIIGSVGIVISIMLLKKKQDKK